MARHLHGGMARLGCRGRESTMKFKVQRGQLAGLLVSALALAAPAFAQVRPTTLSDSQEPGSVIVFPKFLQGAAPLPEGGTARITAREMGVVCPECVLCCEHEALKPRFLGLRRDSSGHCF